MRRGRGCTSCMCVFVCVFLFSSTVLFSCVFCMCGWGGVDRGCRGGGGGTHQYDTILLYLRKAKWYAARTIVSTGTLTTWAVAPPTLAGGSRRMGGATSRGSWLLLHLRGNEEGASKTQASGGATHVRRRLQSVEPEAQSRQ